MTPDPSARWFWWLWTVLWFVILSLFGVVYFVFSV
jgi:hypothetical protein